MSKQTDNKNSKTATTAASYAVSLADLNLDVSQKKECQLQVFQHGFVLYCKIGVKELLACKGRSDVAYSNKKPWKQKGTGRARAGSARSPLWRGVV